MTGGVTPVDNAFELMGLHQCSALMRYVFVETFAGKVIFLLGFLLALTRVLKGADLKALIVYCAVFFCCLILVVIPTQRLTVSGSTMEELGYTKLKTEDILKKAGIAQLQVSPVLMFIDQGISALVNGSVSVVDRLNDHQDGFLKNPFLTAKLSLLTRESFRAGIADRVLKEKTIHFYQDHYFPVLRGWVETRLDNEFIPWAGDESIKSLYSAEGTAAWEKLEIALYDSINGDGMIDDLSRDYYDGVSLKDGVVRTLIAGDIAREPAAYIDLSFSGQQKSVRQTGGFSLNEMIDGVSRVFLAGFPLLYGFVLWSLWVSFPVVLVFLFLSADIRILANFFQCLGGLKLLPLFLTVADRISLLAFDIHTLWSAGTVYIWDIRMIVWLVVLGMVLSVLIVWKLMFIRTGRAVKT